MLHDPSKVIHNLSTYQLSSVEERLLCKGLNYSLPPRKVKFENHLLPFELPYRDVYDVNEKSESLLHLICKIKDIGLSSFRLYNKTDHRYENLTDKEYDAFIQLSGNKNIIIQKADKGNTVVIVDKDVYVSKIEVLLKDTSKFRKIVFNRKHKVNQQIRYLLDLELPIKNCLDDLLKNDKITKENYNYLKPCGSRPGILYGLCKIHKRKENENDIPPFRPILSAIGTCTYNLAKFFVPLLKDLTLNEYNVKDSFSFC